MLITPLQLAVLAIWIAVLSERLLHVLIRTLAYLLFRSYKDREKGRAGLSLFAALINASFSLLSSSVGLALRTLASLFQWGSTVFVLLVVLGFLVLALEFSGHLMLALSTTWNYTLGPTAQVLVVWPLYVFNTIFNALAPIWNAWIWLWHKVPHQILVRTVTQDLGTIVAMGVEVTGLCRSLALSLVGWVGSFVCCLTPADFAASVSGQGICNPQCFEPGNRVMDLMTPMAHLRHFTVYAVIWLKNLCGTLSGPLDILTFPLMDIHFAQGVHFLTNAVLYLCTHLPAITTLRCGLFGAESAVMCIPDFEPVFQMLVAGCRAVGAGLDNWLDVGVLVVQSLLGLPAPECTAIPLALADVATRSALFGTNATAIVGMTAAMFARTDGVAVQYFSLSRDWQTVLHPYAFPFPVDVGLGVAAIAHISDLHHDAGGDDTMALLGCVCEDTDAGMQLQCGAAVFDDQVNATERFIPVVFQLASTARYMACSKAKISVQSLRWPASRTTPASVPTMDGTAAPDPTCVSSKGTCVQADAAVWVRPMCSADGNIDPVCLESFTQSGCFPYCMGLHVRGSVTQPIILHSAQEWTDGVTMLRRDCGLFATKAATLGDDPDNGGIVATASVRGTSTVLLPNSPYGLHARTAVTSNCTYNPYTISLHPRPPAYSAHASIALDDQPFAFMGDLALVARRGGVDASTGEPRWFVEVQRLFGSQQNEFTLIPLAQLIPASAPCTTPADCGNVIATCGGATGCLPAIPYTWDTHPRAYNPGTVTERYAFYATNPDLQPFEAMSYYCVNAAAGNQFTNKFQISAISSYGGIRIWRLNPYLYCPPNPFTGVSQCPTVGTAGSVQIAALNFTSFETALCTQEFFVFATGMDYINPDNIAVTVLRTTLANINTRTLQPLDPTQASYPVLWLNPTTLQWREGRMWAPEAASPALVAGQLCPSQRRTPNVGSIAAEALVSMGLLVRLPLNIVLGMPVVMSLINDKCPVLTRGHWMLKTCGAELLSLEDVFSSIYRANSLFFQGMAIIADGFGPGYPQTFINGLAMHLENGPFTPILPGFAKQLHSLGHVDPLKSLSAIQNAVGTLPAPVQAMQQALHSPIARAHFTYRLFARMLMNMLQAIGGGRTIGNLFWTTYADSLEDYHAIVSIRQRRACGGMALMAGYSTPMGRLTERWCSAYVSLEDGLLTMMAVFTVEVPLMACVCVQSAGLNFREHVLGRCFDDCPDLYKPLLAHLLTQYGDTPSAICPALTAMASTHFTGALDQMFADIESGTDQLASVIDSFITVGLDPQAGDCNNFQDNPYVITLIPEPVDYFRVCGLTSFCRTRCLSEFQAFEALNVAPPVYETVTETVRSPLFAALNPDAYNPLSTALALLELSNCTELCGTVRTSAGGARDRCFLVAGTDTLAEQRPSVIGYCVPVDVTAGVRRAGVSAPSDFPASTADAPLLDAAFVWRPDSAVDFWSQYRLVLMSATTMYQCGHVGGCTVLYALADLGPDVTQLVSFAALGNTLVQKARALDGVLPRSTEVRIFVYTLVELYRFGRPRLRPRPPRRPRRVPDAVAQGPQHHPHGVIDLGIAGRGHLGRFGVVRHEIQPHPVRRDVVRVVLCGQAPHLVGARLAERGHERVQGRLQRHEIEQPDIQSPPHRRQGGLLLGEVPFDHVFRELGDQKVGLVRGLVAHAPQLHPGIRVEALHQRQSEGMRKESVESLSDFVLVLDDLGIRGAQFRISAEFARL